MATLNKHGDKLAEIERLTSKLAYMSDGKILINRGDGWKQYARVKPGIDPAKHAQERQEAYAARLAERPEFDRYRKGLHDTICFGQRYMVNEVLSALSNDPDGVWSELNDTLGFSIDVEECCELCRLYESALAESKELRQAKEAA